jgi:GNAT superfamily N-acetyltransferase
MLDHDQVTDLQRRGLEAFFRLIARAADGSRLHEFPGVVASAAPACPTRSFPNSVVYETAEGLSGALDELAVEYRHDGIEAWTVWVPEGDDNATRILADAGHKLDGLPAAMAIELADLPDPGGELGDLDWDAEATPQEVARLNDAAYGWREGEFEAALTRNPDSAFRLYRARVEGALACVAGTLDVDDDCLLVMVATDPERRGAGLARRLCHAALLEARDRGLETSSLQASPLGRPVYDRLGYEAFGAIEMWERR